MSSDLGTIIRQAAGDALSRWGRDVHAYVEDLMQDLWLWYYDTPTTQAHVTAAETGTGIRNMFIRRAFQLLSAQQLQANSFQNKTLYTVDSVHQALLGTSTNRYLYRVLPIALEDLARQNKSQREAIRKRYEDGVIPMKAGGGAMLLSRAIGSLAAHINVEFITKNENSPNLRPNTINAEARRGGSGGSGDPTANLAIGLIAMGDKIITLTDKDGNVTGETTTYREEFLADGFPVSKSDHRSGTDRDTLFDINFSDIERASMYKAAVFPELFPDEKPFLVENWDREDQEAYCGGEFTPGYRNFSVVR